MKSIFLILAVLFFITACPDPVITPPVPPDSTPVPIVPTEQIGPVKFALYDGSDLRLWDGEKLVLAHSGMIKSAGPRKLAIDDVLYYFDEFGNSEYSRWLNIVPDAIVTKQAESGSRATVVYTDDIYTLENIDPQEAYDFGALYRDYTRIFENSVEIGIWYENQWKVDSVITTSSGHIIAIDALGGYHNLTDNKIIDIAIPGGIILHDVSTQHGYITDDTGTYEITWIFNHFDHSVWQLAGGVWYTENGYTWSAETGVISNANAMYCWNSWDTYPESYDVAYGEKPYIITSGVRTENGEEVTYWIETVTGQLYRHIPSTNNYAVIAEIYTGPGTRAGAIIYYKTLNPVIIEDVLYFHEGGMIKTFDFITGLVELFGTDQELIPWN